MLIGPHKIGASWACVETLCEEAMLVNKVLTDDEDTRARWGL
jgi:hypothetical protein